jgi:O-antigen ligase
MVKNKIEKYNKLIYWCLIFTTLSVTPFFSYDPVNIIKMVSLSLFGLIAFSVIGINIKFLNKLLGKKAATIIYFFVFWLFISLFISGFGLLEGFFGVAGRQTGVLTYLALTSLFLLIILIGNKYLFPLIIQAIWITSTASITYGIIQALGADPFNWVNPYSPVFGFLGNPNFQSSFIAMSAAAISSNIFYKHSTIKSKIFSIFIFLFSIFIIFKTNSKQGYLVLLAGLSVMIYLWIRSNDKVRKYGISFLLLQFTFLIVITLDLMQKTPWKSVLYEESVSIRGDLWRAGWRMTVDSPIFGVGVDGYRDSYRLFRDQVTANRVSGYATVESAHNVFLDISSGGGLPLLVAYVLILVMVIKSSVTVIKRSTNFNPVFAGLFSSWVCYQAQSLISINQIGIAIWGWVLSGALISYEIVGRSPEVKRNNNVEQIRTSPLLGSFGALLAIILTTPILITDAQFRSSVNSGNISKLQSVAYQWPKSVIRMNLVAQVFRNSGYSKIAIDIARDATNLNPRNFDAWQELYLMPNLEAGEKAIVFAKMQELDPFNLRIK